MDLDEIRTALSSEIYPEITVNEKSKLASVLIVIFDSEPKILMTKKSTNLKIHAGEIAFPGGKFDATDKDLLDTSLREAKEELDLDITREQIIGQLQPVTTMNSGFTITSFIAFVDKLPKLKDNFEVESILYIPLIPFLKTLKDDLDPNHQSLQGMYTFTYENNLVWGASARMLKQIVDIFSKNKLF